MLAVARAKLADAAAAGRAALHQAAIDALPLADAAVDGVMVNQVLHHLPDEPQAGWPVHRRVLRELARVLRPGGVLVINSCGHHQIEHGFWPYHLIPAARAAVLRRLMPLDALERALAEAGITPRGRFVPVDAVLQGARLLRPARAAAGGVAGGRFDLGAGRGGGARERRAARCAEALASETYLAEHDARRREIGQITLLYGSKALIGSEGAGQHRRARARRSRGRAGGRR